MSNRFTAQLRRISAEHQRGATPGGGELPLDEMVRQAEALAARVREIHQAGGRFQYTRGDEIYFQDGTVERVHPDGRIERIDAPGRA